MKYALALGGGGARGAFEAGVWSKLCEMNKEISAVAGTSIGAINGAAFIAGINADALWNAIRANNIVPGISCDNILSYEAMANSAKDILSGGFDTAPLKKMLKALIPENIIRSSNTEYGICAYSLTEKRIKQIFIDKIPEGKLVDYIIASACFPIFKNVVINNEEFTDGGLFNNLPADMLIRRGYKNIISVSAGGPGLERDFRGRGVNIIKIKYKKPEQGVMEFNREAAERSIQLGRLECGRVFGEYLGKYFYIKADSYIKAMFQYGEDMINGIEEAGKIIGLNRCIGYSFSELAKTVISRYKENDRLGNEVEKIERIPGQLLNRLRTKLFDASNSIIYMGQKK